MNRAVVEAKLDALARRVSRIERKRPPTLEALITDEDLQDILVLNLAKAVQIAVDIGASIIADTDMEPPGTMRAVFDRLEVSGALGGATASRLRLAAGFRDLAIHRHDDIDRPIVHAARHDGPDDFRAFAREVERPRVRPRHRAGSRRAPSSGRVRSPASGADRPSAILSGWKMYTLTRTSRRSCSVNISVKEFRSRLREILDRVDRGDPVTITSRGKPRARLTRVADAAEDAHATPEELPAFGMWADREDMDDVAAHVRREREGRFGRS